MKRATAAQARQHFSSLLDAAERGETVAIERRGVRFVLRAEHRRRTRKKVAPYFKIVDPAIESGQWTWDWEPGNVTFRDTTRKR
ncbi:MAG: type II toxin-antitoxin system Phd/YefM family antitoxin [Deltaproteobacteria bacterium]|nr:type II toxin-antitoxin system Phd/YefM family antitoxin [Deltaproteobacteria bacterium]